MHVYSSREQYCSSLFFFFRVLHTLFSHLRAHATARSVTMARSSVVQASPSRRQERRWAIVCGSPSHNPPSGRHRDSPISASLFSHGQPLCAVGWKMSKTIFWAAPPSKWGIVERCVDLLIVYPVYINTMVSETTRHRGHNLSRSVVAPKRGRLGQLCSSKNFLLIIPGTLSVVSRTLWGVSCWTVSYVACEYVVVHIWSRVSSLHITQVSVINYCTCI